MKPIDQGLTWVKPRALRAEYQLIADGKALASLRWEKALGSLARAEAADGRWTFKRVGFLRPRVTVRAEGSVADVAMLEPGTGILQFSDGHTYHWVYHQLPGWGVGVCLGGWHGPCAVPFPHGLAQNEGNGAGRARGPDAAGPLAPPTPGLVSRRTEFPGLLVRSLISRSAEDGTFLFMTPCDSVRGGRCYAGD